MTQKTNPPHRGYEVEYIEPSNTSKELLDIFLQYHKHLIKSEQGSFIIHTPQDVIVSADICYTYKIPFKNNEGHIQFEYWDYVAEMTDFNELMHDYRGKLELSMDWYVRLPKNSSIHLKKEDLPENYFLTRKNDHGILSW